MSTIEKLKNSRKKLSGEIEEFILTNEARGFGDLEYIDEYRLEMLECYRKFCNLHERMIDIVGDSEYIKLFIVCTKKI